MRLYLVIIMLVTFLDLHVNGEFPVFMIFITFS